jgi:hypothetical protein
MKGAMLLLLFLAAATILTSCEGQRLAQCDPNCPNGEVPRKEAPSLVQPPWWAIHAIADCQFNRAHDHHARPFS